jgi:hypothetical protein
MAHPSEHGPDASLAGPHRTKRKDQPESKSPPKAERLQAWMTLLNSPFTVTFIGGVVLAMLGTLLQSQVAKSGKSESIRIERSQRKQKLSYDFANEFPLSLSLAYSFKTRKLWLATNSPDSTNHFEDGRTFAETRALYETMYDRYITNKPPASLCNQIVGSFRLTNIYELAHSLNLHMDNLLLATNKSQVDAAFDHAGADYQELTKAIFTELNNSDTP